MLWGYFNVEKSTLSVCIIFTTVLDTETLYRNIFRVVVSFRVASPESRRISPNLPIYIRTVCETHVPGPG